MVTQSEFVQQGAMLLAQSGGCSVWQFRNETGDGTMTTYELFPGAVLSFNDFHMASFDSSFSARQKLFVLDYCREGRMEYLAAENALSYCKAGDLKLDRRLTHQGRFVFPSSHYHGITVGLDLDLAETSLPQQMQDFPVTPAALLEKFQLGRYPRVFHGGELPQQIFEEMYHVPESIRLPYLKIKVLELLLYLQAMEVPAEADTPYFYKTQVEKVRTIRDYLAGSLTESHTQAELSERFDIPLTAMKRCFRSMYGVSIGAWVTACRMDKAAQLLRQGRSAGHIVLPLVSLAALFALDWRLALAALVTFPAALVCMMLTFVISGRSFQIYDESNAAMNSAIVEYIEGIEVIKAFGRAGVSYEKYAKSITDFRTFVVKWLSSTWVTMKLAFALFPSTLIGTLPMSLWLAEKGILTTPQAALAVMLSMSMVGSLAKLEVFSENMRQVKATVESLEAFLELPALPEPAQPAALSGTGVELKNVHFAYRADGPEVLHGIDLTLPQGSFTALVGPSGGGKSTVAKLIARFWDVTDGSITVGGTDVRAMPLSQLSGLVSFVTQDNYLFRCSLLENIRLGDPSATDEQVKAAARASQCEEFIAKLPQGYDTPAGEAGKRLSGGEKQRIAIARMLLKNAPIVILDEATAFTDPENEDKIQQSIAALTRGKTLLVIAHRLSTIKNADNIVVLKEGRIEAQGTQAQLLETCPLYRTMWEAHIGAKAWAVSSAGKEE